MFEINFSYIWLILFIFFLIVELLTLSLVTIWFSISALILSFLSFYIISFKIQFFIFSILSLILLILTKFLLKKNTNKKEKINGIGSEVKIVALEEKNYLVSYKGVIWSAKSFDDKKYLVGDIAQIKRFEGNKIII